VDDTVIHQPALRLRNHDVHRQPLIAVRAARFAVVGAGGLGS